MTRIYSVNVQNAPILCCICLFEIVTWANLTWELPKVYFILSPFETRRTTHVPARTLNYLLLCLLSPAVKMLHQLVQYISALLTIFTALDYARSHTSLMRTIFQVEQPRWYRCDKIDTQSNFSIRLQALCTTTPLFYQISHVNDLHILHAMPYTIFWQHRDQTLTFIWFGSNTYRRGYVRKCDISVTLDCLWYWLLESTTAVWIILVP